MRTSAQLSGTSLNLLDGCIQVEDLVFEVLEVRFLILKVLNRAREVVKNAVNGIQLLCEGSL